MNLINIANDHKEKTLRQGADFLRNGNINQANEAIKRVNEIDSLIEELKKIKLRWKFLFNGNKEMNQTLGNDKKTIQSSDINTSGNQVDKSYRTKLIISPADALGYVHSIPHKQYQDAIPAYWKVDTNGIVKAQSVLWLFCWAKTGMSSETTATTARRVMNRLFGKPYEWFHKEFLMNMLEKIEKAREI